MNEIRERRNSASRSFSHPILVFFKWPIYVNHPQSWKQSQNRLRKNVLNRGFPKILPKVGDGDESARRRFDPSASFEHTFQVGAHDVEHPADAREAVEVLGRHLLLFPGVLQRLDGGLGADLVSELEAVGHCLGGGVDPDWHPGDGVRLDALAKRRPGEVMDL